MRVLLYSRVDPADGGGVQAVVDALTTHLTGRGSRVLRIWRRPHPDAAGDMTCALPLLTWRGALPSPRGLVTACRALLRLARIVARFRPDLVNCHYVTSECAYFFLLRPVFRFRLVLTAHGSDVLRPKPWNRALLPPLLRHADAVTTVSALTAERVSAVASRTRAVHPIPNGIDLAFWSARDSAARGSRPFEVFTVGRLHPVKGHDVLLRAFALVLQRVPYTRLVIGGEGDQLPVLIQLAEQLGVAEAVAFRGRLDPSAVRAAMARASVFALPSRSEGLPLALLEAMAAGVPVIAASVGGVPEVLTPGTGMMVPPEDPVTLGNALTDVLSGAVDIRPMVSKARDRVTRFSVRSSMTAYESVFRSLRHPPTRVTDGSDTAWRVGEGAAQPDQQADSRSPAAGPNV